MDMREATVDQSRRQALKALGSTSALGLSGCCGLAQRQLPDASFPGLRSEVRPFLMRPEQTKVRLSAMPCLDVHAHFFNAKDVPVRAFLQKSVGHDQSSVAQFLLSLMAPRNRSSCTRLGALSGGGMARPAGKGFALCENDAE